MKLTSKKNTMFLAICTIFFMGCSDDDSNEDQIFDVVSEVVYDGETYGLDKGYIYLGGENYDNQGEIMDDSFIIEASLVASGLSYIAHEDWVEFQGSGVFLSIDFNSSEKSKLADGIYEFAGKLDNRDALTFSGGNFTTDLSALADKDSYDEITGGTVKVSNEDGVVTLAINMTTENSTIKGNFSNTTEVIEQ
ncbi:MAG: hypothetical protein ABJH98_03445 [Reichenbachiella sp.]|uniref:hypothetical protein n=1 Tax=Reichenbachiella sp. TaxID=2184521 RepID=UPI0032980BC5